MQINQFHTFLNAPREIAKIGLDEITALTKEFPYCQSAQVIYTLKLKELNHLTFENQLKIGAIYSADRKKLYENIIYLKNSLIKSDPTPLEPTNNNQTPLQITHHSETELPNTPQIQVQIQDETDSTLKSKPTSEPKEKKLEIDYYHDLISTNYSIELEENELTENKKIPTQKSEKEDLDENSEFTFSEWIQIINNKNISFSETKSSNTINKFDLIDKFIQEDPKITPKKTEFYSPVNMARISVVNDSDLVSETLALIQVEQGDLLGAIKTYEKLSLNNPKKRTYFAAQIKILKQKIK